ncbi:MAG: hemolysin family protein [Actinomycetota bacterium]
MTATEVLALVSVGVLLILAGFFGASETALTRMNLIRAMHLEEEGRPGSRRLVELMRRPAGFLNLVLLLTLVVQLTGTSIATYVIERHVAGGIGVLISSIVMTALIFVAAEVAPKTYAIQHSDRTALFVAPLVSGLNRLLQPLVKVLIFLGNALTPGKGLPSGPFVTEEDIRAMVDVAEDEEAIEPEEREMVHSVFEFGDTVVREVMKPRPDIVAVEVGRSLRHVLSIIVKTGYSRIPVYDGDLDNTVGLVFAKDVLKELHGGRTTEVALREILRPAVFVPESKKVAELLREMQKFKRHMVIVVDEYGAVAGLATIEDLLEEIVGEIVDEYDREEPNVEPIDETTFRVNARLPIDELNELLEADLPDTEWDTVGGLMLGLMGRVPSEGDRVSFQGLSFTAEEVKGRRIGKVLVAKVVPEARE